jgi:catechol 2,3-dioxygenase-like lactoylglutathione lyase family enzyme
VLRESKAFSGFSVDDLDAARRVYGETLGLELDPDGPGVNIKVAGGNPVFVYPKADHQPATFTILNFPVSDIEEAVDDLAGRGITFERYEGTELETDEKGIFRAMGPPIAWFKDPAGNVLSVIQS